MLEYMALSMCDFFRGRASLGMGGFTGHGWHCFLALARNFVAKVPFFVSQFCAAFFMAAFRLAGFEV